MSGAGQGLGRAISREMAAEGASVVLLERNVETVEAVAPGKSPRWAGPRILTDSMSRTMTATEGSSRMLP